MGLQQLKYTLAFLQETLVKRSSPMKYEKSFRMQSYTAQISSSLKSLEHQLWECAYEIDEKEKRLRLFLLYDALRKAEDYQEMVVILGHMETLLKGIHMLDTFSIRISHIPDDVKDDVLIDLAELQKCYVARCYRSCIIICGRLLEIALHRTYFETTGVDILEKHPDIGLGTLIAKLVEKNVHFDPGLTQQIHLINNVRISSVHKKKQVFLPSHAQTRAIILFTLDTLEKLF